MKQKFDIITSSCYPLPLENVDTDQIIPARFLKATDKKGFGDNLFRDWRYNKDGSLKKDFVLNDPSYSGVILVAGKNFGSGSSREHAAWAIAGYGFRVVISRFTYHLGFAIGSGSCCRYRSDNRPTRVDVGILISENFNLHKQHETEI